MRRIRAIGNAGRAGKARERSIFRGCCRGVAFCFNARGRLAAKCDD